jgi:hypothetical protein
MGSQSAGKIAKAIGLALAALVSGCGGAPFSETDAGAAEGIGVSAGGPVIPAPAPSGSDPVVEMAGSTAVASRESGKPPPPSADPSEPQAEASSSAEGPSQGSTPSSDPPPAPSEGTRLDGAPPPTCGDGDVDEGEECDGDPSCSIECRWVRCGDDRVDEGEECEPPGEGACNPSCQMIACGNGRLEGGEECEPTLTEGCAADCTLIECGNGRVDEGEQCDPPIFGTCDSKCRVVACGNGVVDEGEGCDPPTTGSCDETCHPLGCGDGQIDGAEECDPPIPGRCDGQCRSIECGNGRVDEGEECEPRGVGSCDDACLIAECGNHRVDQGEQCDPPSERQCNTDCLEITCGDGRLDDGEQCEPALSGSCTTDCTQVDRTGAVALFTFDEGLEGWQLYATSPERLFSGTSVAFDAQNGDETPGALKVVAPFDASNQKVEVQVTIDPRDLRGHTLVARVRLASGLSSDTEHPGGIKLFAKSGPDYSYASGAWASLLPGQGWVDVTLDCDEPILVPDEFDASEVRQIGVELRTFNETTSVSSATIYLDSLSH